MTWRRAIYRYRIAPHGERLARLRELRALVREMLRAETGNKEREK